MAAILICDRQDEFIRKRNADDFALLLPVRELNGVGARV